MSSIYFKADDSVKVMIGDVIRQWHPDLLKSQIRIGILFALSTKDDQPALKEAGYEVDGIIKVVPLKDRVTKLFDVEMILDGDAWKSKSEKHRLAYLDHLLCRIELKKPKSSKPKKSNTDNGSDEEREEHDKEENAEYLTDDLGRPVYKLRKYDWNAGVGFRNVVERHKNFAPEYDLISNAKIIVDSVINQQ